jgi:hypothetical protein
MEAHMEEKQRFPHEVLAAIRDGPILGIRAGNQPHRFIGIWAVVVASRVLYCPDRRRRLGAAVIP